MENIPAPRIEIQMPNETAIVFIVPNSDKQTDKTISTFNSPDKLITLNRFMAPDYHFGIFKLFFCPYM